MELLKLSIGERFDHDMSDEDISIMIAEGFPIFTFNFSVSPSEIKAFSKGAASFALFYEQNMLFFLFKIEGFLDWSDLAFTPHLTGDETIVPGNAFLPIFLVLTEPDSKIVTGLRTIIVSPNFRTKLAEFFREQAEEPFDTMAYYQKIDNLYDQYPTTTDLLNKAAIIEQSGISLSTC